MNGRILKCCKILIKIEIKMIGSSMFKKNGIDFLFVMFLNMNFIFWFVYESSFLKMLVIVLIIIKLNFVLRSKVDKRI